MEFLKPDKYRSHKTYEAILSLPDAPLVTRGVQSKKHEGRTSFKESLDKSGLIIKGCSFPKSFDPLKENGSEEFSMIEKLEILSAYHRSYSKDSSTFDKGLTNGNISRLIACLKKDAKVAVGLEDKEDIYIYAFKDRSLMSTDLTELAFDILYDAFKDDKERSGSAYAYHPIRVALRCDFDEYAVTAALLHDVIEDHGDAYPAKRLLEMGIPKKVVDAVRLLTHKNGTPYLKYVYEAAKNPISRAVKLGDLMDNMNALRNNGKHPAKSLYYFKSVSCLERYPYFDEEVSYYYSIEDDVFFKKDAHNHWVYHDGKIEDSGEKFDYENLIDLTFHEDDGSLGENNLPYFDENGRLKL